MKTPSTGTCKARPDSIWIELRQQEEEEEGDVLYDIFQCLFDDTLLLLSTE